MKYITLIVTVLFLSCQTQGSNTEKSGLIAEEVNFQNADTATVAGGCFWCVEAAFDQIEGVYEAISGYSGGKASTANYRLVSSARTGHAEAVQVYYDASVIDYETILDIFFTSHDPTQVNRQGPDIGPQYRTEIFYHNDEQKQIAEAKIDEIASNYSKPIATKVTKLDAFYKAEEYHQDYEKKNPNNPYVKNVSKPKIDRVAERFKDRLKKED